MEVFAEVVIACANEVGESPVWCELTQALFWLDLPGCLLWRYHPASGIFGHAKVTGVRHLACVALRANGRGFVIASDAGIGVVDFNRELPFPHDGSLSLNLMIVVHPLLERVPNLDPAVLRLNDGRCDPQGRLVVGSYHSEHRSFVRADGSLDPAMPRGGVYRFSGEPSRLESLDTIGLVRAANGTAFFAPAGAMPTMFFVDSPTRTVMAYDYDPVAGPSRGRAITDPSSHEANPDGATSDCEGGYWAAEFGAGRVCRFVARSEQQDGIWRPDVIVRTPAASSITSCTFGGPDLETLYITSSTRRDSGANAGSLFAVRVRGLRGCPEHQFAG
eukprot:gnl/Spiro4/22718_TR11214_c0_g1_i1.p1 gnl/Spiro4/22718_TR11214_c0_g1~~gnl/Spiro4/22718_TR11214_c0_g1_i1.p1  ORF type:complete len:332 (-),score=46.79 gnl/Spiro4/22718_TR11214_c0_g1_i1:29-1024(-)